MKERPVAKFCSSFIAPGKCFLLLFSFSTIFSLPTAAQEGASGKIARPPQDPTLQGRVEQRSGLEKLSRPLSGQTGLNESVRILSGQNGLNGQAMDGLMNANSKEDVLNSTLDSNNFDLKSSSAANNSYQKLTPHSDWNDLSSATATMRTKKPCNPCNQAHLMLWQDRGHAPGRDPWDYAYGNWVVVSMPGAGRDDWRLQIDKVRASLGSPGTRGSLFPDNSWQQRPPRSTSLFNQAPTISQNWTLPPVQPGPLPSKPFYVDQNIGWDDWYKSVSDALYKNWSKINSLPGEAKLRISVRAGRTISAEIVSTDNFKPEFKEGLNKAVASLNGSTILDFPSSSQRRTVTFDSVFTAGTQTNSGAYSERTNDIERIRIRK